MMMVLITALIYSVYYVAGIVLSALPVLFHLIFVPAL